MNKKAFTLIELLAVIATIGIVSSFVVVKMNGATDAANDAKRKTDIEVMKNAIISYRADHNNVSTIETCNIGSNCSALPTALAPYLPTLPTDPNPAKYYEYKSIDGTDCFVAANLSNGDKYSYKCSVDQVRTLTPVAGACGSDDGKTLLNAPTNLCMPGSTPSSYLGTPPPWIWQCDGDNDGSTAYCTAYLSNVFTCEITTGNCAGVELLHMYDPAGGHAELYDQTNYTYKVCCTGAGLTRNCTGNYATVLKLYDVTKSHVEKGTQANYTNSVCLSAPSKTVTCEYASGNCSNGYTPLFSISDGDTSLHIGDNNTFNTKVCCKAQ